MEPLTPRVLGLAVALLAALPPPLPSQAEVPEALQAVILAKALTFDRALANRSGDTLVIVVLEQRSVPESRRAAQAIASGFAAPDLATIAGIPTVVLVVEVEPGASLVARLTSVHANVVYVGPLRGIDPADVAGAVREAGALAMSGVEAHVIAGVPLGVGMRRGRPIVLVNLRAAQAARADFSAQLLRLAHVVGQ